MITKVKESILLIIKMTVVIFLTIGIGAGINFVLADWQPPTQAPPGGNISPVINTSNNAQIKDGGLILNAGNALNGLIVRFGRSGFGTDDPETTVHIEGGLTVHPGGQPIKINTGQAQQNWVLTAQDSLGTAVWAAPQGGSVGGASSCPGTLGGESLGTTDLKTAINACRNTLPAGTWRMPTSEELSCFVGVASATNNSLWTRTPQFAAANSWITLNLSTAAWAGAQQTMLYKYRCVQ